MIRSDDSESNDDSDEEEEETKPKSRYASRLDGMVGRVVLMEQDDARSKKSLRVPVLIILPSAADNNMSLKTREHVLVKSFKDSKL